MSKLTKSALCAILSTGLSGCVTEEYNDYGVMFGRPKYEDSSIANGSFVTSQISAGNLVNSSSASGARSYLNSFGSTSSSTTSSSNSDFSKIETSSAKIGLFDVSSQDNGESLRVKVPYLPALEIPTHSRDEIYSGYDIDRGSFENRLEREIDLVGNSYSDEQPLSLNELSKFVKYLVFNNIKPIKALSEEVSRPVRFVFGDNAKFEINKHGDNLEAKLKFGSEFGERWIWNYELEFQASDDGEIGAVLYFGIKTGIRDIGSSRYRHSR